MHLIKMQYMVACQFAVNDLDLAVFADDFDPVTDDPENEGKCSVVIALMQEHRRSQRNMGVKMLQIGFIIYQVGLQFLRVM